MKSNAKNSEKPIESIDLGQVFTSKLISELMVGLFSDDINTFLDPCFGKGVFIDSIIKKFDRPIIGYEIDKNLFESVSKKYNNDPVILFNKDFLLDENDERYDGIILNPPYIRHEKINNLSIYGIKKSVLRKNRNYTDLPSTSNLYMYFIAKSLRLLSYGGELIIIFPESWEGGLNEDYFYKLLVNNECTIEKRINVRGNAFETNALVDVIILKIKKKAEESVFIEENIEISQNGELIYFNSIINKKIDLNFKNDLNNYAITRRGLTTGANTIFINPNIKNFKNYRYILSSPKDVLGYSTRNANLDKILILDENSEITKDEELFLKKSREKIINEKVPKTLYNKILLNEKWYFINTFESRGIIFSYMIRNNIRFVHNYNVDLVRDNFYIIYPKISSYLLMSLLNNYYTFYQLENIGKRYGKGLLKIQKYDLNKIKLPDLNKFSSKDKAKLEILGEKLSNQISNQEKTIIEISNVISNYSNINFEDIKNSLKDLRNDRLGV